MDLQAEIAPRRQILRRRRTARIEREHERLRRLRAAVVERDRVITRHDLRPEQRILEPAARTRRFESGDFGCIGIAQIPLEHVHARRNAGEARVSMLAVFRRMIALARRFAACRDASRNAAQTNARRCPRCL